MCQPGRPRAPRRVPRGVLARLLRLPEREVARILLQRVRLLVDHVVELRAGELAVVGVARDAEVDVALDVVREVAGDQLLDERDDLRDRLASPRLDVRPAEPEVVGVLEVPPGRLGGELALALPAAASS